MSLRWKVALYGSGIALGMESIRALTCRFIHQPYYSGVVTSILIYLAVGYYLGRQTDRARWSSAALPGGFVGLVDVTVGSCVCTLVSVHHLPGNMGVVAWIATAVIGFFIGAVAATLAFLLTRFFTSDEPVRF